MGLETTNSYSQLNDSQQPTAPMGVSVNMNQTKDGKEILMDIGGGIVVLILGLLLAWFIFQAGGWYALSQVK